MQDAAQSQPDARTARGHAPRARLIHSRRRLPVMLAVVVCAATAAAAADKDSSAPPAEVGSGEGIVQLYPKAVVTQTHIRLGDVAELQGPARNASDWVIGSAPNPGESRVIGSERVQEVLSRRGVNLSTWLFHGASRCEVERPGAGAQPGAAGEGAVADGADTRTVSSPAAPLDVSPPSFGPNTLGAALHRHICDRLAGLKGRPVIEFSQASRRFLSLSQPTYAFRVKSRSSRLIGLVPLEAAIYEKGELKQTVPVLAQVGLARNVVVAARAINAGKTLEAADLKIEERVFDQVSEVGFTEVAPLVGQRMRRFMAPGALVDDRAAEPVPLISRNDLVTVLVRRGSVTIEASATALTGGGYGDTVTLRNELSGPKETLTAVVTGLRTAQVVSRARRAPSRPMLAKGDR